MFGWFCLIDWCCWYSGVVFVISGILVVLLSLVFVGFCGLVVLCDVDCFCGCCFGFVHICVGLLGISLLVFDLPLFWFCLSWLA